MSTQPSAVVENADERDLVAELTRRVLADAAPEEMGVFGADEAGWIDGRAAHGRPADEMLGFGAEAVVLMTPYIVAAATAAVRYISRVLAQAVEEETRPMVIRWVRHVLRLGETTAGTPPAPPLPVDLVRRVHDVTFAACHDMGLADDDATMISDSVAGRLVLAPA